MKEFFTYRMKFFCDPKKNILNIEMKFSGYYEILNFCILNEIYYACLVLCGDRNFKMWIIILNFPRDFVLSKKTFVFIKCFKIFCSEVMPPLKV